MRILMTADNQNSPGPDPLLPIAFTSKARLTFNPYNPMVRNPDPVSSYVVPAIWVAPLSLLRMTVPELIVPKVTWRDGKIKDFDYSISERLQVALALLDRERDGEVRGEAKAELAIEVTRMEFIRSIMHRMSNQLKKKRCWPRASIAWWR